MTTLKHVNCKPFKYITLTVIFSLFLLGLSPVFAQASYNEAPTLAERVAAGELPPVEERLPLEPWVIEPLAEIGQYGGTIRTGTLSAGGSPDFGQPAFLFFTDEEGQEIQPHLGKALVPSEDYSSYTIQLREGLKWSDGYPFTVDDILFWWNDVILNEELTPSVPQIWTPGGNLPEFVKIDDYTLELHFGQPYRPMMFFLAGWGTMASFTLQPKHYLQRWHLSYNPDADDLAKQEGFESWTQSFQDHTSVSNNPETPTLNPFVLVEKTTTLTVYERNPYFGAVDTAGNQLPYVDNWTGEFVSDKEVLTLRLLGGELDLAGRTTELGNYSLYQDYEEQGDYRTLLYTSGLASEVALAFNQNHRDPVVREIFQDKRFRQAMSLAIDRQEISDLVYVGFANPVQATVLPSASYFKPEWRNTYTDYDPERARELLAEMGLTERNSAGYLLMPDGRPLTVNLQVPQGATGAVAFMAVAELLENYWEAVGVQTLVANPTMQLYLERSRAGELDVGIWTLDRVAESRAYLPGWNKWDISDAGQRVFFGWANDWGLWYETRGEQGEEPNEDVAAFFNAMEQWQLATTEEEYLTRAQEVWDMQAENLFLIGTVADVRIPIVVGNRIGNVPEEMYWSDDFRFWYITRFEQFYIKQ